MSWVCGTSAPEEALQPVLAAVRRYSEIAVTVQLAHAGRMASIRVPWEGGQLIPIQQGGWLPQAPSALPYKQGEPAPLALDASGLARVRRAFADAATRAARLGLDAIEIHSAHGYLLHEFLSPIANQRTDEYGGSLANRLRFPLEVFDAVRAAFPADKPVGVKVSATDWVDGGWDLAQTIDYARELQKRGADWVAASSGGLSPLQKIPLAPGYQVPFAEAVKRASGINTMAVGLITEPQQAEDIVASSRAGSGLRWHRRDALRSALAVARGGPIACERDGATPVLALTAAGAEEPVRRGGVRPALKTAGSLLTLVRQKTKV